MIHAVYDITCCTTPNPEPAMLLRAMRATVNRLGCTVLGGLPVIFQPHGITCVLVLAESHLTVSTWPEHQLAHIDLFTCRADADPEQAIKPILDSPLRDHQCVLGILTRRLVRESSNAHQPTCRSAATWSTASRFSWSLAWV